MIAMDCLRGSLSTEVLKAYYIYKPMNDVAQETSMEMGNTKDKFALVEKIWTYKQRASGGGYYWKQNMFMNITVI